MPRIELQGITVSLVLLGLALSISVPLPGTLFSFVILGSELTLEFSGGVQLALLLSALVCAGTQTIMGSHPGMAHPNLVLTAAFWPLPALIPVVALILLSHLPWWGYRFALIAVTGALLWLTTSLQYRSIGAPDGQIRAVRTLLNTVAYALALALFVALYGSRARSVLSATGILLVGAVLALELFRGRGQSVAQPWLYAGVVGLMMGESTWALNYASLDAKVGGGSLLLVYYAATGLAQQHLSARLTRRVVIEYAVLCAAGLALLSALAPHL